MTGSSEEVTLNAYKLYINMLVWYAIDMKFYKNTHSELKHILCRSCNVNENKDTQNGVIFLLKLLYHIFSSLLYL